MFLFILFLLIFISFVTAHKIQNRIMELQQLENRKYIEEKEKKLKINVEKLKSRHELENDSFQMKMTASINEFKKNRTNEYERLVQRFKNKLKDLEIFQKNDINSIAKLSN